MSKIQRINSSMEKCEVLLTIKNEQSPGRLRPSGHSVVKREAQPSMEYRRKASTYLGLLPWVTPSPLSLWASLCPRQLRLLGSQSRPARPSFPTARLGSVCCARQSWRLWRYYKWLAGGSMLGPGSSRGVAWLCLGLCTGNSVRLKGTKTAYTH